MRTKILLGGLLAVSGGISIASAYAVSLQDTTPPYVSLDPGSLDFNEQVVGRTSASKRITAKNTGGKPLYVDSVSSDGDNSSDFSIVNDRCTGATVGQNKACIIDVAFTPSVTGERDATLKLTDNAAGSPQTVNLTGNGINANDVPPFKARYRDD